jgi:hypothetical protein
MHAVIVKVAIGDLETAEGALREQVVPRVSQARVRDWVLDAEGRYGTVDSRFRVGGSRQRHGRAGQVNGS